MHLYSIYVCYMYTDYFFVIILLGCTSERYYFGSSYAIICILIYPVFVPAFYFYLLYTNRKYIMNRLIDAKQHDYIQYVQVHQNQKALNVLRNTISCHIKRLLQAYKLIDVFCMIVNNFCTT